MQADLLLRKLLEGAGGVAPGQYVLALEPEGLDGELPSAIGVGTVSVNVHRTRSELGLRRVLWKSRGAPFVALLPEEIARALPPDLIRRAKAARVHALDPNDVLAAVLQTPVTGTDDPELLDLALSHLSELRTAVSQRTVPTVIDRRMLDELLLDVCVGQRVRKTSPGDLLAGWLSRPPDPSPAVRHLLERNLPVLHAVAGRVLAWALRSPSRLTALVERGILLEIEAELPPAVWGELDQARGDPDLRLAEPVLRTTIVQLAREAIEAMGDRAAPYFDAAASLGAKLLAPSVLAQSTLLPLGLDTRCYEVAERAARGEPIPETELVWISSHRAARLKDREIRVLRELARLSRWLATPEGTPTDVAAHVERYQLDAAFADLSAARLRRAAAATAEYRAQADKILAAWRSRRDRENRGWAELLAQGYVRALHAPGVVPLHRMWREGELADSLRDKMPLYVIVLDGCSYPVFLALLRELAQIGGGIGLALGADERARGIPALSPLPTITSHARGALFLGELPNDPWIGEVEWREQGERKTDPGRFRQNKALAGHSAQLFLKGDLSDGGSSLLAALADRSKAVVAAVFNAVDDQIGSSNTGAELRVSPTEVHGLVPSLEMAFRQGRRVLVTADHGHSPFCGRELRVGDGKTPRWMKVEGGQALPDGFIAIDDDGLGGQAGPKAFAWKVGAYRGTPQVGFHGGCSLEEMVVPLAWLVPGGVPATEPIWWYGGTEPGRSKLPPPPDDTPTPPASQAGRPAKKPRTRPGQYDLFDARRTEAAVSALDVPLGLPEPVMAQLDVSERAALVTLKKNGRARVTELEKALQRPRARIPGFMRQLQRKLHKLKARCFDEQVLPSGEQQYVWCGSEDS
ncbi:MAG: BREX-2 system phosphatase PglZ [Polyangiaceae bacterium]|nr:BREX-2 system phosphatase PglZ [Polyangiaceae bacterium]